MINADDFYGADAFRVLSKHLEQAQEGQYAMVGYQLQNTLSEHGTVSRGVCTTNENMILQNVTERTSISGSGSKITFLDEDSNAIELHPQAIVSMNCWGFTNGFFKHLEEAFNTFILENAHTLKSEFYIPTVVNNLVISEQATVKVLQSSAKWFGVTYREDRENAMKQLKELTSGGIYKEMFTETE